MPKRRPVDQWTKEDWARWAKSRVRVGRQYVVDTDNDDDPWNYCIVKVIAKTGDLFRCQLANARQRWLAKGLRHSTRAFTKDQLG